MEAAVLIPVLALVMALLLEPACLLYTQAVMRSAASEAARAAATDYGGGYDDCRALALRRLRAVPEVPCFHVGGEGDWQVDVAVEGERQVHVAVVGHARPLPLMGVAASAFGESDGAGIVLRVEVDEGLAPEWLEGGYGDWLKIWG